MGVVDREPKSEHRARDRERDLVPVSHPGDRHEHEARAVAGQPRAGSTFCSTCASGAPCTSCGRSAVPRSGLVPDGGAPLAPAIRARAEAELGPIGDVRIHAGGEAGRAAHRLQANAYTYGSSIVFADGAFAPQTPRGYQLLVHELVHTQQDPRGAMVHRSPADEPTADQLVRDPTLWTDAMIDEVLSGQDAVDAAEEDFAESLFTLSPMLDTFDTFDTFDAFDAPPVATPGGKTCSTCHTSTYAPPPPTVTDSSQTCATCHIKSVPSELDNFTKLNGWSQAAFPSMNAVMAKWVPTDAEIEAGDGKLWKLGPRNERFRYQGYDGPPRAKYTKPLAIAAAEMGNYDYAELAENYMCPTCHIVAAAGHVPNDNEFSLYRYTRSYERAHVMLFNMNPVSSAWNLGVATEEAIHGRSSGLDLNELMMGESQMGRPLTGKEQLWRGGEALIGWATLGAGKFRAGRPPPIEPLTEFGPPRLVYSGPGAAPAPAPAPAPMVAPRAAPIVAGEPYAGPSAAYALDPAPMAPPVTAAPAPARVPWLTEVPFDAVPPPLPKPFPAFAVAPPLLSTLQGPRVGTTTAPQPLPQAQTQADSRRLRCPPQSKMVVWPFPYWTTVGYGDFGSRSGLFDFPPTPLLVRRKSPRRSRSLVRRYMRTNAAALAPYLYVAVPGKKPKLRGAVHHKVPLYLGGPDSYENLVFAHQLAHYAWHTLLSRQGKYGWMIRDPYGTVYCVV